MIEWLIGIGCTVLALALALAGLPGCSFALVLGLLVAAFSIR